MPASPCMWFLCQGQLSIGSALGSPRTGQGAARGLRCRRVGQMAEGSYPNSPGSLQRETGAGLQAQSSDSHGATDGNAGRNLKEWLREQFCDHPLEHCEDTRLHDAAYVGDLETLRSLLQEESFQRYGADVDVNHHLPSRLPSPSSRPLTSLVVCPLYISAAYHNLQCFKLLLQAGANPDFNCCGPVNIQGFSRGSPVCVMDAVLRHGCEPAFINLLIDFGANLNLVTAEALAAESTGRVKVNPEALQVFKEARSCPRSLLSLCRVALRRILGKYHLHLIHALPVPDPIKQFLLHEQS
ncbi:ankyrin repeat and SOCS box protein 1 isoform 3-T3 [Macrochelys suwanniensis]